MFFSVTEQPYKIPYYATLLQLLHNPNDDSVTNGPSLGRQILDDLWKGFQIYLDKLAWRETRLCVGPDEILPYMRLTPPTGPLIRSFNSGEGSICRIHD
jgi:hypothetical protein